MEMISLPYHPPPAPFAPAAARPAAPVRRWCAAALARACDDHLAACWRGEAGWAAFGDWLAPFWRPGLHAPPGPPAAVSVLGGGGRGIAWYDAGGAVLGVVPGLAGGYRVPADADPPGRGAAATAAALAARYDRCVLGVPADGRAAPAARAFAAWLAGRWYAGGLPAPARAPDAVSGRPGRAPLVRWYALGGAVLGYPAGPRRGRYVVAAGDEPPDA
jgi:hypothetical protein